MKNTWRTIRTLLGEAIHADPKRALLAALASIGAYVSSPSIGLFFKWAADSLRARNTAAALIAVSLLALLVSGLTLLGTGASKLRIAMEERTGFAMERNLITLESKLSGLEHHEDPYFIDQWELLRGQSFRLGQGLGALFLALGVASQALLTGVLLFQVSPLLLVLPAFGVPLLIAGRANQALAKATEETVSPSIRQVNHILETVIQPSSAKEIRALNAHLFLDGKLREAWIYILSSTKRSVSRSSVISLGAWIVFGVGYSAAIGYVAIRARAEGSLGDLVLVMTLAGQVHSSLNGTVSTYSYLQNQLRVARRYLWVQDYVEKKAIESPRQSYLPTKKKLTVEFRNVTFCYPGSNQEVLRDISMELKAPETIALVGENGAGKTTLVKLLLGYYEPTEGVILVNGTPLKELDIADWRSRCSAVFQDFSKYEFLLGESVGVGYVENVANNSAIRRAINDAEGTLAIWKLPDGLEAQLGPTFGGIEPSTGQWQAISIARSRMNSTASLLILDEPSASLDTDTEAKIFSGYQRFSEENKLLILISHRLASVRTADKIVLIDQGAIVEMGSHDQLMNKGGKYAVLFSMQAKAYG